MNVLVVVVNFRTPALVIACLRSLEAEVAAHTGARVTVVDNASGDGSAESLKKAVEEWGWQGWVEVIASPVNGGFAAGNNVAVRAAQRAGERPELFWLVNPDAEVRPGALAALVTFMADHPRAGIAGGSLENADGQHYPFAFRFPSLLSELEDGLRFGPVSRLLERWKVCRPIGSNPMRVDWISGANFMIRSTMLDRVGPMDEGYFLYFEETDYCQRARAAGWECWYIPEARVMHIAGQSTGMSSTERQRRPAYWFESRRRYFVRNHGVVYAMASDLLWMSGFALWRIRRMLARKSDQDPPGFLLDFARHSALFNPLTARRGIH